MSEAEQEEKGKREQETVECILSAIQGHGVDLPPTGLLCLIASVPPTSGQTEASQNGYLLPPGLCTGCPCACDPLHLTSVPAQDRLTLLRIGLWQEALPDHCVNLYHTVL